MAILHQVSMGAQREQAWECLGAACASGDTVVLMEAAVSAGLTFAAARAGRGVHFCVPRGEQSDGSALSQAIELIDDVQWWQLIADHELIQHWM